MRMTSVLLFVALFGGCGLMLWGSSRIEPHWVSKDGERLICYGQAIDRQGRELGRWREMRVTKVRDDTIEVRPRHGSLDADRFSNMSGFARGRKKPHSKRATYWRVGGATTAAPRNRTIFLLEGSDDSHLPFMLAIRVPNNSRAIPMLQGVSQYRSRISASTSSPETSQSEERPDQD